MLNKDSLLMLIRYDIFIGKLFPYKQLYNVVNSFVLHVICYILKLSLLKVLYVVLCSNINICF